jgi:hypothetical protein
MKAATLVAGAVLTAGAAIALPATAFAATTTAAHPSACAKAHGKYQGKLVKTYWVNGGNDTGTHVRHAGITQAWHSAKCETVWSVVTKTKAYSKKPVLTVTFVTFKTHGKHVTKTGQVTTRGSVSSPAMSIGKHATVSFNGGWLGAKYTFDSEGAIKF